MGCGVQLSRAEEKMNGLDGCYCERTCSVKGVIYREDEGWTDGCKNCTCTVGLHTQTQGLDWVCVWGSGATRKQGGALQWGAHVIFPRLQVSEHALSSLLCCLFRWLFLQLHELALWSSSVENVWSWKPVSVGFNVLDVQSAGASLLAFCYCHYFGALKEIWFSNPTKGNVLWICTVLGIRQSNNCA